MKLTERSVELPWLLTHIGTPRRLLDIGSADAAYVPVLYELCRDLYLCDTRPFVATVPAEKHIGSAHRLPQEWTDCFDLVTCVSMLDHVGLDAYGNSTDDAMLPAVIAEMGRVLISGGRLLVTAPVGRAQVTKHPGGGQRIFDLGELLALFDESVWNTIQVRTWRLVGEHYQPVASVEVADAEYLEWRAEAVAALEVRRV